MTHETLDTIIVSAILLCSIYECWILTKEYQYDEAKDLAKKQRRTRTTKKTTTNPGGSSVVEEINEVMEPISERPKGEGQ